MMPHPTRPAASGLARESTLTAWSACTKLNSVKAPMPRALERTVPSSKDMGWLAFRLAKQYHGLPRRHDRHVLQGARQAMYDVVPDGNVLPPRNPRFSTIPAASWPRRMG